MKHLLFSVIILLGVSINSQAQEDTSIISLLSSKVWTEIYKFDPLLTDKDFNDEYDLFFVNEQFWYSTGLLIIRPHGSYATEYSPQCGTGQQDWWDIFGVWEMVDDNIIKMTVIGESLGYINTTPEMVKELENTRPENPEVGKEYYYGVDFLLGKYLCFKMIEKP